MRKICFLFTIYCLLFTASRGVLAASSVPSVMFKTWDYQNTDFGKNYPQYGPIGSIFITTWDKVNPASGQFNWEATDNALNLASQMQTAPLSDGRTIPKPVILQIDFWYENSRANSAYTYSDYTPAWVYGGGKGYEFQVQPCDGKTFGIAPKVDTKAWQDAYFALIREMGRKYGNDSRVTGFVISVGMGAEAFSVKGGKNCTGSPISPYNFKQYINNLAQVVRQSFTSKTAYMTLGGEEFTKDVADAAFATTPYLGLKSNALDTELGHYQYSNNSLTFTWPMANFDRGLRPKTSWAFEDAKVPNAKDIYFMTLWVLSGHGDWIDWRDIGHFQGVYSYLPTFWTEFVPKYLGKNISDVSSVWSVLRETKLSPICWTSHLHENVCQKGREGDFNYWLYRQNGPGGTTIPVWQTNLPSSTQDQIYSLYARRTDQSSGNNYMYFKVDNNFSAKKSGEVGYKVKLIFVNSGTDKIGIEYKDKSGQLKTVEFIKGSSLGASGKFIEKTFELRDAYFNSSLEGNDFRISSMGDGDEIVHMVLVERGGWSIPTATPISTSGGTGSTFNKGWNNYTAPSSNKSFSDMPSVCPYIVYKIDGWFNTYVRDYSSSEAFVAGRSYQVFCRETVN